MPVLISVLSVRVTVIAACTATSSLPFAAKGQYASQHALLRGLPRVSNARDAQPLAATMPRIAVAASRLTGPVVVTVIPSQVLSVSTHYLHYHQLQCTYSLLLLSRTVSQPRPSRCHPSFPMWAYATFTITLSGPSTQACAQSGTDSLSQPAASVTAAESTSQAESGVLRYARPLRCLLARSTRSQDEVVAVLPLVRFHDRNMRSGLCFFN